ncbi:FkbM family methyltransferase [Pantanalinema rosaneae CENA516]|uniref:FkbM family methyltransferase n=1 Tax=Pantanalinema rosaneae TaxID=1620701 RepID=UPI003D6F5878
MGFSLSQLFTDIPPIDVVDVGASPIDGEPPYQALLSIGKARVVSFEPNPEEYQKLLTHPAPGVTVLPYAIGDGQDGILNICQAPGMTSLLTPDHEILEHFYGFDQWSQIIRQEPVSTYRLDDVREITAIDYLKLDVQGGELAILNHATRRLQTILVIHTEVQFVPFYQDQPLFAELDQTLRAHGFYLHSLKPLIHRTFKPLIVNNDIFTGLNQLLWGDAVYVKKFTAFADRTPAQLLKIALIMHDLYGSFDLCALALEHVDHQTHSDRQITYLNRLTEQ